MRILRITVENLASLAGRHTVDFTTEPLRSTGLFAIIGPTGSGKSTLLDAMCLALFHQTPRLQLAPGRGGEIDEISQQDTRNLLRRGASRGLAEVAFVAVDGSTCTARWNIRRARNKADGKLQEFTASLHLGDLRDDDQGEVIVAGKKKEVAAALVERLGLTFHQFTRAVLLAQNEFSNFLRAQDSERAAILEALTDTSHFTRISKAIHERCSLERSQIESLKARLNGQTPLTPDARQLAKQNLQAAHDADQQARETLALLEEQLRWHAQNTHLTNQLTTAENNLTAAAAANTAAAPRRERLQRIVTAQREAAALHQTYQSASATFTAAERLRAEADSEKQTAEQAALAAETAAATAQLTLNDLLAHNQTLRNHLLQARNLDTQLALAQKTLDERNREYNTAHKALEEHTQTLNQAQADFASAQSRKTTLQASLQELAPYQPLAENAERWLTRLRQLAEEQARTTTATNNATAAIAAAHSKHSELAQFQRDSSPLLEEISEFESQLQELRRKREDYSDTQLNTQRLQLNAAEQRLTILQNELQRQLELQQQLAGRQREHDQLTAEVEQDALRIAEITAALPAAEQNLLAAQSAFQLIYSAFDDHAKRLRTDLQPDHPCPVCGSIEHPWSTQPPDVETLALQRAEEQRKAAESTRQDLQTTLAKLEGTHTARSAQLHECRSRLRECDEALAKHRFSEPDEPVIAAILALPPEIRRKTVASEREQIRQTQAQNTHRLNELLELDRSIRALNTTLDSRNAQHKTRVKAEADLQVQVSDAEKLAAATATALESCQQQLQATQLSLAEFWPALPDSQSRFETNPQLFLSDLEEKLSHVLQIQADLQTTENQLLLLNQKIDGLAETHRLVQETVTTTDTSRNTAQATLEDLQRQRSTLLDGQSADHFEAQLEQSEKSARNFLDSALQKQTTAKNTFSAAAATADSTRQQHQKASSDLQHAESSLNLWLNQFFPNLPQPAALAELQSLLQHSSAWIADENRSLEQLQNAADITAGAFTALKHELSQHQQQTVDTDEHTLRDAKSTQEQTAFETLAAKNEADRILKNDDDLRQQHTSLAEQIAQQEEIAKPWEQLSHCIGSADGKKFNLIAQRYTLDLLLQHANLQLQQLARRYRLERLGDSLNLAVIDQDLGDERRSVHSLSGGETFLVSLALALGLASLTSNRIRIESLFIDEGFGSLDEDTLEIAMNALNHLQSQGRKVGIITHVERMKDAIPVQIQVRRNASGSSRIVLPQMSGTIE